MALPKRVLIISAEMGEGHNAAAQALTETICERWPGSVVERLDTMELRGVNFARAARWAYGFQLSVLPWSYAVFYHWLSRSRRFAGAARTLIGTFFGRHLARVLEDKGPDLVISTYPFGSAALDWLRSERGLNTMAVTYIPAFHVHPLWAYSGIDLHFVMYESAARDALLPGFEETMRLGGPPVRDGFGAVRREDARQRLGLDGDNFVVLVTGGAWGLGNIASGVKALIELGNRIHVVAVCGKNATLVSHLRMLLSPYRGRLTVYGYVDNMPEVMAASDVVVTNGAGVTVLEALRTPRPVIAFAPLAGHGTASTAEMVRRGLALKAGDVKELVAQVKRLATEPELALEMQRTSEAWGKNRDLHRSVDEIAALYDEQTLAGAS